MKPKRVRAFRASCPHGLTQQQSQVMHLLGQGMMGKQIAVQLEISKRTVEIHCAAVYKAIGVKSSLQFGLWYSLEYPVSGSKAHEVGRPLFAGWVYAMPGAADGVIERVARILKQHHLVVVGADE